MIHATKVILSKHTRAAGHLYWVSKHAGTRVEITISVSVFMHACQNSLSLFMHAIVKIHSLHIHKLLLRRQRKDTQVACVKKFVQVCIWSQISPSPASALCRPIHSFQKRDLNTEQLYSFICVFDWFDFISYNVYWKLKILGKPSLPICLQTITINNRKQQQQRKNKKIY
jgi:hypothetical protein